MEESKENPHIPSHTLRSSSADRDKQHKEREKRIKQLRLDFAMTFGSPEGKRVLKHIAQSCGFGESVVGGNPQIGMDVLQGMLYNAARLNVYLELRKFVPHETLKEVEYFNNEELFT